MKRQIQTPWKIYVTRYYELPENPCPRTNSTGVPLLERLSVNKTHQSKSQLTEPRLAYYFLSAAKSLSTAPRNASIKHFVSPLLFLSTSLKLNIPALVLFESVGVWLMRVFEGRTNEGFSSPMEVLA